MCLPRTASLLTLSSVILALVVGCDDPNAPPEPGAIRVVVVASGEDVSVQGLRVTVGDQASRELDPGRLDLTILGLPPGIHSVRLDGFAVNCHVPNANPRSVTVVSNDTTTAEFNMFCTARVGSVRVTTATTGVDVDPDGYTAMVIGGPSQPIPVNGTATIANVREGPRMVTLGGVSPNCAIAGPDTAVVTVQLGATVDVAFSLQCEGVGSLEVTVATTGVDLDADGYHVTVDATSVSFRRGLNVAPNESVLLQHLRPAVDYNVTFRGVAANCDIVGEETWTVAVTAGATTRVRFDVNCQPVARLAFERDGDIYVIGSNGSDLTRLTTDPDWDAQPAWSSTGRIAFASYENGDRELYVMNENGTSPVRITTSAGIDDAPSWSPDGQRIVFQSARDANNEIYVVNADGTALTRLTNNTADDREPAWSGTGKIAFISDRDAPRGEIYVMNADGSNVIRVTTNDSLETNPAWSPDGSMLAFAREVEPCGSYGCSKDIFVMNADGSNVRRLATGWASYHHLSDPSWSPNGRAIAFTRNYVDVCDYCLFPTVGLADPQGTYRAEITSGANPAWKP